MLVVRTLIFDLFQIPTPSMEKSLLVGDYLFVSKLHYGTRLPTGLCLPFSGWCVPGLSFPYTRLPGFTDVDRFDAIVFNYPPEEGLIDEKLHYIKRVVGLPGETLAVRDKAVYVEGERLAFLPEMQRRWVVRKKDARYRLPRPRLREIGISWYEESPQDPRTAYVEATEAAAETLRAWQFVASVQPWTLQGRAGQPRDQLGPVLIPAEGLALPLTDSTLHPYHLAALQAYEGRTVRRLGPDRYEIDGRETPTYTFTQDYYFVMGDNRDNSEDSRFWGFVPFDHVVGKAVVVYFSRDPLQPFWRSIRTERLFQPIR